MLLAFIFIFANLLVDLLYGVARPEDLPGMSNFRQQRRPRRSRRRARARSASSAWVYAPLRRPRPVRQVAQPDRDRRGRDRRVFNVFVAVLGPQIWTIDPNELVATPLRDAELGPSDGHRRARPRHARPHHPRRAGVAPGGADLRHRSPSSLGVTLGLLAGFFGGWLDSAADALRRPHVRAARDRARDRDRGAARAEPAQRDDRDRDRDRCRRSRGSCAVPCSR